jgi:hypothetical protein
MYIIPKRWERDVINMACGAVAFVASVCGFRRWILAALEGDTAGFWLYLAVSIILVGCSAVFFSNIQQPG